MFDTLIETAIISDSNVVNDVTENLAKLKYENQELKNSYYKLEQHTKLIEQELNKFIEKKLQEL